MPLREQLYFDSKSYRNRVLDLIAQARSEVLVTSYIMEADDFGGEILNALIRRAESGVKVQLCIDGYGSSELAPQLFDKEWGANFEVRVYHPPPWWAYRREQFFHFLYHFNIRNHQKIFIFDGRIAMIGSRNIHDEALIWRETSVEVEDANLSDLKNIFENLWARSHGKGSRLSTRLRAPQLPVPSPHFFSNLLARLRDERNSAIRQKLEAANTRILITTPYFLPRPRSLRTLKKKARAGVEVSLLLPCITDVPFSKWLAQSLYKELIKAGVRIYEYQPTILHAKTLIVDDWALVGSSNFNRRSSLRDLELDYSPREFKTVQELLHQFRDDIAQSKEVKDVETTAASAMVARWLGQIFYSWF